MNNTINSETRSFLLADMTDPWSFINNINSCAGSNDDDTIINILHNGKIIVKLLYVADDKDIMGYGWVTVKEIVKHNSHGSATTKYADTISRYLDGMRNKDGLIAISYIGYLPSLASSSDKLSYRIVGESRQYLPRIKVINALNKLNEHEVILHTPLYIYRFASLNKDDIANSSVRCIGAMWNNSAAKRNIGYDDKYIQFRNVFQLGKNYNLHFFIYIISFVTKVEFVKRYDV